MLYLKVLTGDKVIKVETPMTKVSLAVESVDFGSFPQSEKQERKFTLTNTGQHVLVIYDVVNKHLQVRVISSIFAKNLILGT